MVVPAQFCIVYFNIIITIPTVKTFLYSHGLEHAASYSGSCETCVHLMKIDVI